jgi:hypothetical protein
MYTSLEIKGFRCFKHLKIDKLARINLIGGKNNTGKTALLEAVRLLAEGSAHPERTLAELYRFRGLPESAMKALRFEDLAQGFDVPGEATVYGALADPQPEAQQGKAPTQPSVRLSVKRSGVRAPEGDGYEIGQVAGFHGSGGAADVCITDDGRIVSELYSGSSAVPCVMVPAREHTPLKVLADMYAKVQVAKLESHVVAALKRVDDRAGDLVIVPKGETWLLYADFGEAKRMPLSLVGEGMSNASFLLIALCNVGGGVLLVDEIENGLHYSVMADVWRAIAQAAVDLDVQVFATTHSHECVEAAAEAIPEGELLYHRLDRIGDDIECQTYSPRGLEIAIQTGNEFR